LVTGKDQWINIKESRDKANEYKNTHREFSVDELVSMVKLMEPAAMDKDKTVKDLRFELYFHPESSAEIFKKLEMMFPGHIMVKAKKSANGKFVLDEVSAA
jgi:hypothetical protein